MNNNNIEKFMDVLYPYIKERLISEGVFKNFVQRKNATVKSEMAEGESNIGSFVKVALPYDITEISVKNETGQDLKKGDLVCLEYSIDIKNAIAVYKVN